MDPQFLIGVLLQGKIVIVSLFIIVLLPIVFYVASLDRRPVKVARVPSVRQVEKREEKEETKNDEKDNNKGGEGT